MVALLLNISYYKHSIMFPMEKNGIAILVCKDF